MIHPSDPSIFYILHMFIVELKKQIISVIYFSGSFRERSSSICILDNIDTINWKFNINIANI